MKHKFLLGALAGASALIVGIPLVAQLSSAQSAPSAGGASSSVPSQACVEALVARDDAFLATIDADTAARKSAIQAHEAALKAAAAITDDAQREAAVQKANVDLRTALQNAKQAEGNEKTVMDNVKSACGDIQGLGFGGWEGRKGHDEQANDKNDPSEGQDKNEGNDDTRRESPPGAVPIEGVSR
jgi:hypothetical protein